MYNNALYKNYISSFFSLCSVYFNIFNNLIYSGISRWLITPFHSEIDSIRQIFAEIGILFVVKSIILYVFVYRLLIIAFRFTSLYFCWHKVWRRIFHKKIRIPALNIISGALSQANSCLETERKCRKPVENRKKMRFFSFIYGTQMFEDRY